VPRARGHLTSLPTWIYPGKAFPQYPRVWGFSLAFKIEVGADAVFFAILLYMAQISKREMKVEIEEKIYLLFDEVLGSCGSDLEARMFMKELLTETEQTVMAKRLAIALMLLKGFSYNQIDRFLKVSPPTVFKVKEWLKYKGEAFKNLLERLMESETASEVWDGILREIEKEKRKVVEPEQLPSA
jgi:uncharacterized protein YerC